MAKQEMVAAGDECVWCGAGSVN